VTLQAASTGETTTLVTAGICQSALRQSSDVVNAVTEWTVLLAMTKCGKVNPCSDLSSDAIGRSKSEQIVADPLHHHTFQYLSPTFTCERFWERPLQHPLQNAVLFHNRMLQRASDMEED